MSPNLDRTTHLSTKFVNVGTYVMIGLVDRWGTAFLHFPMQKLEKMRLRMSSVAVAPVRASREESAS